MIANDSTGASTIGGTSASPGFWVCSIAEADPGRACSLNHVVQGIDPLGLTEDLLHRHGYDVRRLKRHHVPPLAVGHGAYRRPTKPGREQAVVARRRATALEVSEDQRP